MRRITGWWILEVHDRECAVQKFAAPAGGCTQVHRRKAARVGQRQGSKKWVMLSEFGQSLTENIDMILISDGGGNIVFVESQIQAIAGLNELPSLHAVATDQKPAQSFALLGGRLFHLALTPVTAHSNSEDFDNTLAVLVEGSELNRRMALELKRRALLHR